MIKRIYIILLILSAVLAGGCAKPQNKILSWAFHDEQNSYMVTAFYGNDPGESLLIIIKGGKEETLDCDYSEITNGKRMVTVCEPFYKVIELSKNNNLLLIDKNEITELRLNKIDSDYVRYLMKNNNEIKSLFSRTPGNLPKKM